VQAAEHCQAGAERAAEHQRAAEHDVAPHPVGEVAGGEREHEHRQELGKTDHAEVERAVVLRVDLPADRDIDRLRAMLVASVDSHQRR
jgi:hypothetical protein